MRILLDTHALLWCLLDSPRLSREARKAIDTEASEVLVSVASVWEIGIKHCKGKLPVVGGAMAGLPGLIEASGFSILPIALDHALEAAALPDVHRDPFDRMLVAQARVERLTIVTVDSAIRDYGVAICW